MSDIVPSHMIYVTARQTIKINAFVGHFTSTMSALYENKNIIPILSLQIVSLSTRTTIL
jgi:hypothetical protein